MNIFRKLNTTLELKNGKSIIKDILRRKIMYDYIYYDTTSKS